MIAPVLLLLSAFLSPDDALVERLGSDSWEERAQAERALQGRGWAARHSLRRGLAHPDPEVRLRAGVVYAQALSREVAALGPFPEIDAAYYVPELRFYRPEDWPYRLWAPTLDAYLNRVGRDGYPYDNYRLACRLWVTDVVEAGVPAWALRPVLAEMTRRDNAFLRRIEPPRYEMIDKPNPNPAPFWWWPLLPRFGPPPVMPPAP